MSNTRLQNGEAAFVAQFKKFIADNGVVGTTAGVIMALASKDLITSLVGDIIIPLFILLFFKLNIKSMTSIFPGKSELSLTNFLKHLISWIITMMVTYFFIKTTFEFLLGIKKEEPKQDKKKESFFSR